jgi:non-heme chloroperoxidase
MSIVKTKDGRPHGLCTTHKERVNGDLLSFIRG